MTAKSGQWDDLLVRLSSGGVIAGVGLLSVWLGGVWFLALTVIVAAVMIWELARMLDAEAPALALAGVAGVALLIAELVPSGFALPLIVAPALVGFGQLSRHRTLFTVFSLSVLLAAFGLYVLRQDFGFTWIAWLVIVVAATDIFGYFAGRFIGGPKFWPRVSPKKTWSGTAAGWIAAAVVGLAFLGATGAGWELIGVSIAISMASQIGDIAESAVKRRVGVKDSSSLLPGHGGLFDRFDGMLGASIFLLIVGQIVDFPPGLA
ncbi:phosphatidate cytidylyltransferase [Tranquillimonas alkanivorans]|uniref:Phosphatidate cytidylyltransferase n=1 Tax=Tranquillimonas alkanivorans TaxID=441119 RepID=A0A1I5NX17_9RHOB|nr:phosphatidate cytidylyltransferase [Tranquillimonas alkanivorans]SFP25791.1 phosphatidate cytidylyltransferase [Tranquillimonas alkanivorans]